MLGHAAIHDKVLVVDPFSTDCEVVTGSHNLGFKASFANDENMVTIRGNRKIAERFLPVAASVPRTQFAFARDLLMNLYMSIYGFSIFPMPFITS